MKRAGFVIQSASEQNRKRGVFHAADGDGAVEAPSTLNKKFFHVIVMYRARREDRTDRSSYGGRVNRGSNGFLRKNFAFSAEKPAN